MHLLNHSLAPLLHRDFGKFENSLKDRPLKTISCVNALTTFQRHIVITMQSRWGKINQRENTGED